MDTSHRLAFHLLRRTIIPIIFLILGVIADFTLHSRLFETVFSPEVHVQVDIGFAAFYWLAGAWLFSRSFTVLFWDGIFTSAMGRTPPRLIVQLFGVIIFLLALSGIVYFVFQQSITAIWATSGAIGIVIGLALRNLILDTFSGLAIHMERPFEVGEWITFHSRFGKFMGRVDETNWRTTRLWEPENNVIIIPNSMITSGILTNLSRPNAKGEFYAEFVMDFAVPVERATRVLNAAASASIGSKGLLASPEPKVQLQGTGEFGVKYRINYFIDPSKVPPGKAKHAVITNTLKHMRQAGMTLPNPRRDVFVTQMPWRQKDWQYHKDQIRHLAGIKIFESLEPADLEFIANNMSVYELHKDDVVVEQGAEGDSMFILAEGLLDVRVNQEDSGEQIKVADLAPGTFFGEKSLLTGEQRSATITCVTDCVVCEITKNCIAELLENKPELATVLAKAMAERELQNQQQMSLANQRGAEEAVSSVVDNIVSKIKLFFNA